MHQRRRTVQKSGGSVVMWLASSGPLVRIGLTIAIAHTAPLLRHLCALEFCYCKLIVLFMPTFFRGSSNFSVGAELTLRDKDLFRNLQNTQFARVLMGWTEKPSCHPKNQI